MERLVPAIIVFLLLLTIQLGSQTSTPAAPIACRALETYSDAELKAEVVIFHQRDEAQRQALAALLRENSGQSVEIQVSDGAWRRARMVRLKSCFGRGLLLLPAPSSIAEHAEFLLRTPVSSQAQ